MKGRNNKFVNDIYKDNSILLFALGLIWLISAGLGSFKLINLSILTFLSGTLLVGSVIKTFKHRLNKSKNSENLDLILSCLTIGMPLGIMLSFFPFIENSDLFFPAFAFAQCLIFAVAANAVSSKTLMWVSASLLGICFYSWYHSFEYFLETAYITSALYFVAGAYFRALPGLKNAYYFQPVKTKTKNKTVPVR